MRAYLPAEVLRSIPLPTFEALFAAFGRPPGLAPDASHAAIADALAAHDLPDELARAFFLIAAFEPDAARAEIHAIATALGLAAPFPDAASPADLVARLLAASATNAAAAEILAAAKILRDRSFRARSSALYAGAPCTTGTVGKPARYAAAIEAELAAWSQESGFGPVSPVRTWEVDRVLFFEIVHEDRPGALRRLRSHLVTFDPARRGGRLTITTDAPQLATSLAEIFGRVLFGAERHFLDTQALDLWRLQELGAASLDVPELAHRVTVHAIGGTWHSGKNHIITPRGRDFFKALARYKIRIEGGRLTLVTLRATVISPGDGPRTCDIVVSPPHLLTISEPELAPLMFDWLDRARITSPDPRVRDFISRQPWNDQATGWIESESEEGFRELVARGILKADPSNRSVTPPKHPHAGRIATAHPLSGTKYLACCADPTIAPFVVEERDLTSYALQFDKLAAMIAEPLGLQGHAKKLDDDGVLFCGRRTLDPTKVHVHVHLPTRPLRPATAARLVDAAGDGHAFLVVPEGREVPPGMRRLAMPPLAGPWQPLLLLIVHALRIEQHVPTIVYAPTDARVVLDRALVCFWIDGVLCGAATETHFRLLEAFLISDGRQVHTKELAEHIAPGHAHGDTTRRALETLVRAVERSFKLAKKKPPKDLAEFIAMPRLGYYMLTVKGFID